MMADRIVPYDWEVVGADSGWRKAVAHPLSPAEIYALLERQLEDVLDTIAALPDPDTRHVALLAAHGILGTARGVLIAAATAEKAGRSGISLISGHPVVRHLIGLSEEGARPPRPVVTRGRPEHPRHAGLRALGRTLSWNPMALLRCADATAVTHNSLLSDAARREANVIFRHASSYFRNAGAAATLPVEPALVSRLTRATIAPLAEGGREARAAQDYLQPMVEDELGRARATLAELRQVALPSVLWSASGGQYWARALGLEVMRRGGQAVRFDHGGTTGLIVAAGARVLVELAVSTRFAAATPVAAATVREAITLGPGRPLIADVQVSGQRGDSHFESVLTLKRRARAGRLRVLYAPSILFGFRSVFPPSLPDLIYLDWQFRLVEALKRLPVDLLCRPHPEGIFSGQKHPLTELTVTESRPFEQLMDETDVVVLDYPISTTFGYSLCTEKPMVYLDIGIGRVEPAIKAEFERRARVVGCAPDSRNRPALDEKALADAIFSQHPVDPTPFRALFLA